MTLWLHVHGGYPSYAMAQEAWGQDDHDAHKLIQLLKGQPINGYVRLKAPDGTWPSMTTANPAPAFQIFGHWAAETIKGLKLAKPILVPVPSSTALKLNSDPKGENLARAIMAYHSDCQHFSGLHWGSAMSKASKGGARDPDVLFNNLHLPDKFPDGEIVLVDDVASSGGHLVACAKAIRSRGYNVVHAVCAAQTVNTHPAKMWAIESRDLEAPTLTSL